MKRLSALALLLPILSTIACAQVMGGTAAVSGCACLKNQPYSAETINITDRVLADGNRIHRETHGKVYRDSEGRTRTETEMMVLAGAEPFRSVMINDPVTRTMIILQRNQVATVNHYGEPSAIKQKAVEPANTQAPMPKIQSSHEDLGVQDMEGIQVRGSHTTRTIPAGAEGNEQPIVVTFETWHSPELGITVLSKTSDPRSGSNEHRLTNIQRTEPDPALFQIPSDYTVKETKIVKETTEGH